MYKYRIVLCCKIVYSDELVNARVHIIIDTDFTPFSKSTAATRIAHTCSSMFNLFGIQSYYDLYLLTFLCTVVHIYNTIIIYSRKMRRYRYLHITYIGAHTIQTRTNDVFTQRQYFRSCENLDVCALARFRRVCTEIFHFDPNHWRGKIFITLTRTV